MPEKIKKSFRGCVFEEAAISLQTLLRKISFYIQARNLKRQFRLKLHMVTYKFSIVTVLTSRNFTSYYYYNIIKSIITFGMRIYIYCNMDTDLYR